MLALLFGLSSGDRRDHDKLVGVGELVNKADDPAGDADAYLGLVGDAGIGQRSRDRRTGRQDDANGLRAREVGEARQADESD